MNIHIRACDTHSQGTRTSLSRNAYTKLSISSATPTLTLKERVHKVEHIISHIDTHAQGTRTQSRAYHRPHRYSLSRNAYTKSSISSATPTLTLKKRVHKVSISSDTPTLTLKERVHKVEHIISHTDLPMHSITVVLHAQSMQRWVAVCVCVYVCVRVCMCAGVCMSYSVTVVLHAHNMQRWVAVYV